MLTSGSNLNPLQSQSLSVQGYKRTAWAVEQLERDLGRGTAGTSQTLFWGQEPRPRDVCTEGCVTSPRLVVFH